MATRPSPLLCFALLFLIAAARADDVSRDEDAPKIPGCSNKIQLSILLLHITPLCLFGIAKVTVLLVFGLVKYAILVMLVIYQKKLMYSSKIMNSL
ncbi:uncharacterized protein A4U43_C07F16670 [Asparagus officinalis]|uniref:Uncharacterized protein n=1 Tax=Asparagus officinalis TaxID=4686 RepID=A0A5P1ECH0_ASPOF|nr:uncharacterized protein A4U43_C07F16670 [Asparagus officinalis]